MSCSAVEESTLTSEAPCSIGLSKWAPLLGREPSWRRHEKHAETTLTKVSSRFTLSSPRTYGLASVCRQPPGIVCNSVMMACCGCVLRFAARRGRPTPRRCRAGPLCRFQRKSTLASVASHILSLKRGLGLEWRNPPSSSPKTLYSAALVRSSSYEKEHAGGRPQAGIEVHYKFSVMELCTMTPAKPCESARYLCAVLAPKARTLTT